MKNCDRHAFDREFHLMLTSGSSEGCSMLAFIGRTLTQFRLNNSYNPSYILNDAYMRGIKFIESGGRIDNPLAWTRSTAYNIIRELSRERKKFLPLEEGRVEDSTHEILTHEDIFENMERVKIALTHLNAEDKELLQLKIVNNLSWNEIYQYWKSTGRKLENAATLRKRKQRALKKLRTIYHSLEVEKINLSQDLANSQNITQNKGDTQFVNVKNLNYWKSKIAAYQQQVRDMLVDITSLDSSLETIDPWNLELTPISGYKKLGDRLDNTCLYFVLDVAAGLILYIGAVQHRNKELVSTHKCKFDVENYTLLHNRYDLPTEVNIAWCWDIHMENQALPSLLETLVKQWKSPFNKENRHNWGQPFA
ncbi:sigma-70 family RNA polymerase sigma factor [Calothrix rhizosoleniae]|uniref:sigma-70 family RNA polymerase sigma factor n=1 Tax=Calothrix rhizosoleniae TaxID=888997 RepID=UPI001177BB8F